jgi:serine O-acetyltransferase
MSKIVYYLYALASTLSKANIPFLPKIIQIIIRLVFGCYIPYTAQIGKNTVLGYGGLGIVIHARCVIGENCVIGPGVTLGGTSHKYEVPKLGNNVLVGPGAKVLGPVKVGNNVVIGANAVVTKDIADNTLVGGIPAKIIKENIDIKDYM